MALVPFILVIIWGNSSSLCDIFPVVGGAIGGLLSALGGSLSVVTMKTTKKLWLKLLIGLLFTAGTILVCFGVAKIILSI